MTIVCCWLDESYGRRRLTAIADARAATKDATGKWHPLSETTTKLFKVTARCYTMDTFSAEIATWRDPYYQTEIAICFAGYCFEAQSIISLLSRCLEQLVTEETLHPKPEPLKIVEVVREIMARYFKGHSLRAQQFVELLMFGFCPTTGEPWVGIVRNMGGTEPSAAEFNQPVLPDDFFAIGDVAANKSFRSKVDDLRQRIGRHARGLKTGDGEDAKFEHAVERERHKSAGTKIVEELTLEKLDDDFSSTVGGVLQKMELYQVGDTGVASFSRDDRPHILDGLPSVSGVGLVYIPIGETMGKMK